MPFIEIEKLLILCNTLYPTQNDWGKQGFYSLVSALELLYSEGDYKVIHVLKERCYGGDKFSQRQNGIWLKLHRVISALIVGARLGVCTVLRQRERVPDSWVKVNMVILVIFLPSDQLITYMFSLCVSLSAASSPPPFFKSHLLQLNLPSLEIVPQCNTCLSVFCT